MKPVIIVAVGGLLLGVAGFFAGRASVVPNDSAEGSGNALEGNRPHAGGPKDRSGMKEGWRSKGDARAATRRVMAQLERSPMMNMDFDALFTAWELFRDMSLEEIQQALEEIEEAENPQIGMLMKMMLMGRWGGLDGAGAMAHALEMNGMQKMMAINGALMGWMKKDPDGAYAWYEKNRDEMSGGMMGRNQIDSMLYSAMAQSDLAGTMDKVASLEGETQKNVINAIARDMVMNPKNREEFFQMLEDLPDKTLAPNARESLVRSWAWQDPKRAAEFIESLDVDSLERKKLEESLSDSWKNSDPQKALEWRLSKEDGSEERQKVIEDNFGDWLRSDEKAASEWLKKQPDEVMTDDLFKDATRDLRNSNKFDRAAEWANQIIDDEARSKELGGVYRQWKIEDETAAGEWLATLDEGERETVMGEADGTNAKKKKEAIQTAAIKEMMEKKMQELENTQGTPEEVEAQRQVLESLLEETGTE